MAKVIVDKDFLEDGLELICDSIRLKTGGTGVLAFPVEMKQAVDSISGSGILPSGTLTITENTPDGETVDVTEKAAVIVNVPTGGDDPVEQAVPVITVGSDGVVTATATQEAGSVAAGTKSPTHQLSSSDDADFVKGNIKNGVTIFGVEGNYGSDATAQPAEVVAGRTYYGPAGKKTGTMQSMGGDTYTPGTSNRTLVPANRYVSGDIIMQGDPLLVPQNIRKNVTIFGVGGQYAGGQIRVRAPYTNVTAQDSANVVITPPSIATGIVGVILSHAYELPLWSGDIVESYAAFLDGVEGYTRVIFTADKHTASIPKTQGAAHATVTDSGIALKILSADESTYGFTGLAFDTAAGAYWYSLICVE